MRYRAIQWATGTMGGAVLRGLIDHPSMELVGVYVYSDNKCGRDAGGIVNRPPTGVRATNLVEEILELEADVVIHCGRLVPPYGSHDQEIIRLLTSGKNVISINGYSKPAPWDNERYASLKDACHKGGTTLTCAGLNPGYACEQLAIAATAICQELDHVKVTECTSCKKIQDPVYAFDALGFGANPNEVDPNDPSWGPSSSMNGMYIEVMTTMAEHLNLNIDRVETAHKAYVTSKDLHVRAGMIPKGRISHTKWEWHGYCDGAHKLTLSINWYMETTHLDNPNPPLWQIGIDGKPGVTMSVDLTRRPNETDRIGREMQAVAGTVVNSISVVCGAAPGVIARPIVTPFNGSAFKFA